MSLIAQPHLLSRDLAYPNVNAYHSRLMGWLARFKGMATSYLTSYLGWFRALDRNSRSGTAAASRLALAIAA
jgi:hypothetical protein